MNHLDFEASEVLRIQLNKIHLQKNTLIECDN